MSATSLILRGAVAFFFGLILVIWPSLSLEVILVLFPLFVIIDGIGAIMIGRKNLKNNRWTALIPMGILEILVGIFVLIWPGITVTVFVFLMALWALVLGISEFVIAFSAEKGTRLLFGICGVITFILGILFLAYPLSTSVVIMWLVGLYFLIYGVFIFSSGIWLSSRQGKIAKS